MFGWVAVVALPLFLFLLFLFCTKVKPSSSTTTGLFLEVPVECNALKSNFPEGARGSFKVADAEASEDGVEEVE